MDEGGNGKGREKKRKRRGHKAIGGRKEGRVPRGIVLILVAYSRSKATGGEGAEKGEIGGRGREEGRGGEGKGMSININSSGAFPASNSVATFPRDNPANGSG